jgi:hypothetical protein
MRRLTIVGTTPKGDAVILSDDKGAKFLVANDPRLAAVTDRQLEMALQTFSPREIQARVRAGASAELIAAETGWPLDKVLRYAEPLLAERAYIAEQAQAVEIRRSGGGSTLLETASAALGVEPEADALAWDAWRRDDGKWLVSATYSDDRGIHSAEWSYDHTGRNLHPLDDEARMLMGVRRESDEIDDLTDALDLIADRPEASAAETRPRLVAVPDADDDMVAAELDIEVETDDDADVDVEVDVDDTDIGSTAASYTEETVTVSRETEPTAPATAPAAKKPAARKPKARRGRASVPSWDEILFGATRSDD